MAYNPAKLAKIMIKEQGAWGTAATVTASDQTLVECELVLPAPAQAAISTETVNGDFYSSRVIAGAKADTTVSIKMPLHGWSESAPTASPAAAQLHADALLLKNALGGVSYDPHGYGTSTPGATANDKYTFVTAEYSAVDPGMALLSPSRRRRPMGSRGLRPSPP